MDSPPPLDVEEAAPSDQEPASEPASVETEEQQQPKEEPLFAEMDEPPTTTEEEPEPEPVPKPKPVPEPEPEPEPVLESFEPAPPTLEATAAEEPPTKPVVKDTPAPSSVVSKPLDLFGEDDIMGSKEQVHRINKTFCLH